jgi:RHS repeat-associated protein
MQPLEVSFTVADSGQYQVLLDAASPQVLAMLDEAEGVSVLFDEPVVPAAGMELESAITVTKGGAPVAGSVTRISPWQLAWRPSESSAWILGGEYRVSIAGLVELGPEQKPVSTNLVPVTFTHLASGSERILVATQPPETPPRASSAFGNTTLFQGRLWVPELGLYYFRARWYDPQLGDFLERDPLGPVDSPNLYQALGRNPINITDPQGLYEKDFHFYAVYYLARAAGFAPPDARLLAWSSQYVDDYEHTQPVTPFFGTLAAFHFLSPVSVSWLTPAKAYGNHGEPCCEAFRVVRQEPVKPMNQIARENLTRAVQSKSLIAVGIALHSWADTFAHAGFTAEMFDRRNARPGFGWEPSDPFYYRAVGELAETGHSAAGHTPDWPFKDVGKAMEAAESIYNFLRDFAQRHGYDRYAAYFGGVKTWPEIAPKLQRLFNLDNPDLEARVSLWKRAIPKHLDPIDAVYARYDKDVDPRIHPEWVGAFQRWVEEQRNYVMKLYGVR